MNLVRPIAILALAALASFAAAQAWRFDLTPPADAGRP
jgi:hypothetical protein